MGRFEEEVYNQLGKSLEYRSQSGRNGYDNNNILWIVYVSYRFYLVKFRKITIEVKNYETYELRI